MSLFDPEPLKKIATQLATEVPSADPSKFDAIGHQINAVGSSYICRARDNSTPKILNERALSQADLDAGVRIDRDVVLGAHTSNSRTVASDHPVRYIKIEVPPHVRTGSKGSACDGRLRLVTNMMDVPAELIAEAYGVCWLIALFFRMIKQLLGCRHLLSTKPAGVEIQMYLAIIACLLILIYTGGQPTKRTYEMICFYLLGWASLEELEAHFAKWKPKTFWEQCAPTEVHSLRRFAAARSISDHVAQPAAKLTLEPATRSKNTLAKSKSKRRAEQYST